MEEQLLINNTGVEIQGFKAKKPRQPQEAAEGVNSSTFSRAGYLGETPGAVSYSQITTADLLSEGRVDGLVTGEFSYVGTAYNTGWTSYSFNPYNTVSNVKWLRSIYWNQVPLVNPQDQYNYQSINVAFTEGLPNGTPASLQIANEVTVVRPVGERLRYGSDFTKTYRILNKNAKAADINIKVNQLLKTSEATATAGDVVDTAVVYNISYRQVYSSPGRTPINFSQPVQETITGKITMGYIRTTRISFYNVTSIDLSYDPDFLGWEIKLERITPDSTVSSLRNQTFVDSLVEVYGDVFTYPNSAIVGAKFSAEFFSQIPNRAYELRGVRVSIPSTYNPTGRFYFPNNGDDWDGSFRTDSNGVIEKMWTDNPAWCYFDLLTNRRYGLGKYITGADMSVDKWTLYEIGRYCDVLVSDGYGGLEPRFSCNLSLDSRDEAFTTINNMASIFRGMAYYGAGTVYSVQDSPKNNFTEFTNANVENGEFIYSSSSKRVRHTVATVHYNDKRNFYKPSIEYVEDIEGIRRYGIRELDLVAYGCTSRGQAVRFGRWALLTETTETETVNFTAGLEGAGVRPGDVIQIFDYNRRGSKYGGRTSQIFHPGTMLLDREVPNLSNNPNQLYYFHLLTPGYTYDTTQISDLTAHDYSGIRRTQIQVRTFRGDAASGITGADDIVRTQLSFSGAAFDTTSYSLTGNLVWMIESSGSSDPAYKILDYFRVINVEEKEPYKYNIGGMTYNVNKYNQIESGLNFQTQSIIDTVPAGPTNLELTLSTPTTNSAVINYRFSAADVTNVSKFLIYVKRGSEISDSDLTTNQYLVNTLPPTVRSNTYIPAYNDRYYFRIYAATAGNTKSTVYANNDILVTNLNPIQDIKVFNLGLDAEVEPEETNITTTPINNPPGTRLAGTYFSSDPTYLWDTEINTNALPNFSLTGIGYRVSVRAPSVSNTPSKTIYYSEITNTGLIDNLKYTYTFTKNSTLSTQNAIDGNSRPYRTYDVVVEAVNTHDGTSAAGGNYKTANDTDFSNSNGYDIFAATNPPINNFNLTTPAGPQATDAYITDQWMTTDGDIKLWLKQGVPPDWLGGYAYVWTGFNPFTRNEAYAKFSPGDTQFGTTDKNIVRLEFIGSGDNGLIALPTGITGYSSAYMSVSPGDLFDLAALNAGTLLDKNLTMSNVVKIQKRLGFNDKVIFKSWIEITLDYHNQIVSDWSKSVAGISSVTFTSYNDPLYGTVIQHNINFAETLASNTYTVVAPYQTAGGIITKNQDGFTLQRFQGTQFFGILYNGSL